MAWPSPTTGVALRVGLVSLFFLALLGQYVYREATSAGRAAPLLRGLGWWAIGVAGAVAFLRDGAGREPMRLAWLGLSVLLVGVWAAATVGRGTLDRAFYAWAALYTGLFVLYWQFSLSPADDSSGRPGCG